MNAELKAFVEKNTPKEGWAMLERRTLWNEKRVAKNEYVGGSGMSTCGIVLKAADIGGGKRGYVVSTRTVENATEKVNSIAIYDADFGLVGRDLVNVFATPMRTMTTLAMEVAKNQTFKQVVTDADLAATDDTYMWGGGEYHVEMFSQLNSAAGVFAWDSAS